MRIAVHALSAFLSAKQSMFFSSLPLGDGGTKGAYHYVRQYKYRIVINMNTQATIIFAYKSGVIHTAATQTVVSSPHIQRVLDSSSRPIRSAYSSQGEGAIMLSRHCQSH